jgi:hypothetical protein
MYATLFATGLALPAQAQVVNKAAGSTLVVAVDVSPKKTPRTGPTKKKTDLEEGRLKVFLDCTMCDQEFIRQTIKFVDYVRDRNDAQVHVLETYQMSGTGMTFVITLIGRGELQGRADTLSYAMRMTDAPDNVRTGYARTLSLGLAALAAKTGVAEQIRVHFAPTPSIATALPTNDPWNHWTFNVGGMGFFMGEKSSSLLQSQLSATVDRTTAGSRISMWVGSRLFRTTVNLNDVELSNKSTQNEVRLSVVRTTGEHWGVGIAQSMASSALNNQRLATSTIPTLEYNVFPYSEYDRRNVVIQLGAGFDHFRYREETIYFKMSEMLPRASIGIRASAAEPWGSTSLHVNASRYLNDASKNRVSSMLMNSFRIVRGLDLTSSLAYMSIHDQLFLPRAGATVEDVLLQRRQLQTSYSVNASLGFTYTFGSALNKGVNPIMRAPNGGLIGF